MGSLIPPYIGRVPRLKQLAAKDHLIYVILKYFMRRPAPSHSASVDQPEKFDIGKARMPRQQDRIDTKFSTTVIVLLRYAARN